jgi:hypothetical protein
MLLNVAGTELAVDFKYEVAHDEQCKSDTEVYMKAYPNYAPAPSTTKINLSFAPNSRYTPNCCSYQRITNCIVDHKAKGQAVVGTNDQFNRAFGRKVALARALKNTDYTPEFRAELWKAYFQRCK